MAEADEKKLWQNPYFYRAVLKKNFSAVPEKFYTKDMFIELFGYTNTASFIKKMPPEFYSDELFDLVIKNDIFALKFIPDEYKSLARCKKAVSLYTHNIAHVENQEIVTSLLDLVRFSAYAFLYLPLEEKTTENAKRLLNVSGRYIKQVDNKFIDEEACIIAMNKGAYLDDLPEKFLANSKFKHLLFNLIAEKRFDPLQPCLKKLPIPTFELCKSILKTHGYYLKLIPKSIINNKKKRNILFSLALKSYPLSLKDIEPQYLTKKRCELALKRSLLAIDHVPSQIAKKLYIKIYLIKYAYLTSSLDNKDQQSLINQLKQELSLKIIPKNWHQDDDFRKKIYQHALELDGLNIKYIPLKYRSKKYCELAYEKNAYSVVYFPENYLLEIETGKRNALLISALQNDSTAFLTLPRVVCTEEVCLAALSGFAGKEQIVNHVPAHFRANRDFCLKWIKLNPLAANYIDKSMMDNTFINEVIDHYHALFFKENFSKNTSKNFFNNRFPRMMFYKQFINVDIITSDEDQLEFTTI